MKYLKWLLITGAAALLALGCQLFGVQGNGREKTLTLDNESFTRFTAENGAKITLVEGDLCGAVVRVDENLAPYLEAEISGGTLSVGFEEGNYLPTVYEIEVTAPWLERIGLSAGCRARGNLGVMNPLTVSLSGGSTLCCTLNDTVIPDETEELRCPGSDDDPVVEDPVIEEPVVENPPAVDLTLNLSGGSCSCFRGTVNNLVLSLSGGSEANLGNLACGDVTYSLSGGSEATVLASGSVAGTLSGGSTLLCY